MTNRPPPAAPTPKPAVIPPPSTGYLTKVNATGTGLVWSTFFSGTGSESITDLRLDTNGTLVIAGLSGSRDLPDATPPPVGCNPGLLTELAYVARLAPEAAAVIDSRYVYGFGSGRPAALDSRSRRRHCAGDGRCDPARPHR